MNQEKAKQITRAMKTLAREESRFNINELRVIVALERAIARLSNSKDLVDHLVFKGGFVLLKSYGSSRFTRDADALAISISKGKLENSVSTALIIDLDDGLWFGDIQVQELTDQDKYGAYRFSCAFQIGSPELKKLHKLSRIHIDIGVSDRLPAKPADQVMSSVLDLEEPVTWKIYPVEYIVAEKLHTLFDRGSANSRAKDIYDLIYLFPRCEVRNALRSAITNTFGNRDTPVPTSFAQQADRFDKAILANGWPGVKLSDQKPNFEAAWRNLMDQLATLDG